MTAAPLQKTLFWDFFGPRAEGTASHFQRHLAEFLEREGVAGCETGVHSEGSGHHAAFCRAPEHRAEALIRALRPRRVL